jgi:uncharacterized protein (TIGR03437 family)
MNDIHTGFLPASVIASAAILQGGPLPGRGSTSARAKRFAKVLAISSLLPFGLIAQQTRIAQPDRIAGRLDPNHLAAVKGNIHPNARPENDRGAVSPNLELDYITLHLKPTPAQQADLDQFLTQLQDPASPNHYKWLTPEQYADRFGASLADIAQITNWLQGQGLSVIRPARGRNFVVFKGTAAQVQAALRVEIHRFLVDGETHFANVTEPSVPAAILPFTIGFFGLDDFKLKPPAQDVKPFYNYQNQHVLGPADLWVIYDTAPFYSSNVDVTGTGMKLAVAGQSNVNLADMAAYQAYFGLPSNPPVKLLIPGGTDPGITGDQTEADLDLEMTNAMAPNADIVFVYASNVENSANYAIDAAVAPVLSYSYAACEVGQANTAVASTQTMAQQASAEGITWLASSGDVGAAACDAGAAVASKGISVMLPASVPEVTGVGGTTLAETATGTFWASVNGGFGYSALSYIPETGWNDTSKVGHLAASGGGMSVFFPKPAWQTGPGIPGLNVRFVPDVALSSSPQHDPYFLISNGTNSLNGGTSAATPVFAGIVLLVNQYLGTNGLGNINPGLYQLASNPLNVCTTNNPNPACVFHDIQTGTNIVPCVAGTGGCVNGILGYSAGPGYDMVTGLGSIDAANLTLAWQAANQPALTQIFNAASFVDSGLSPGLIFSVKGSGLGPAIGQSLALDASGNIATTLAGVKLLVNGIPAPLLYVSANQINAVAPYEIANMVGQHASVQVFNNGVPSSSISDAVVTAAPAMFNLGNNQAAVINQDGTVNGAGNPAPRGTYISIYATGEGQTIPAGIDGFVPSATALSRPIGGVTVFFNQFSAQVLYSGTASFDGFFQVNAVVPVGVTPGAVPITLTVGGTASPTLNVYVK